MMDVKNVLKKCSIQLILASRLKHPTDEGVIPETSRINWIEHFFMDIFYIQG